MKVDQAMLICRCEEISNEEIEEVIRNGARTFDDMKRLTRCGMGSCQSKICASLVSQIIYEQTGSLFHEIPLPRTRMPLSPIKLETLTTNKKSFSKVKSLLDEVDLEEGEMK